MDVKEGRSKVENLRRRQIVESVCLANPGGVSKTTIVKAIESEGFSNGFQVIGRLLRHGVIELRRVNETDPHPLVFWKAGVDQTNPFVNGQFNYDH